MTRMKLADTKVKETNAKRRESGVMANDQLKKIIGGILGEEGKDKMYEERGAGMRKKGKETNGKGNTGGDEGDEGHKDEGAGPSQRKEGRGAGRGETVKGGGASQDQDTGGSDGRYSYPLVGPRLEEVRDDSTLVHSTGTDRSTVHYHDVMDNPPYSQHLEGGDGTDSGSDTYRRDTHDDTHHGRLARDDAHHNLRARDLTRESAKKKEGDAGRYKEVRSIRGGGRRTTRWVKVNLGGGRRWNYTATRGATPPSSHLRCTRSPWARW